MRSVIGNPQVIIKCVTCSCMSEAFKMLTNDQLLAVDTNRSEITFRKGEMLCKQGSFMSQMMFIRNGLVKIYLESDDHPTIVSVETNGYFIGLSSIFNDRNSTYPYSVEALTQTEVCQVNVDLFKQFCFNNHEFSIEIIRLLSREVVKGYNHMFNLTQKQIRGRFAELILNLSEKIYHSLSMKLSISRKDMADLISTSAESVSRLIKEFNDDGIINCRGDHLKILDKSRLEYISEVG